MENTTVVKELLEDKLARGLHPDRRYLFVIDEAKAVRAGIERVYDERAEVQRCQIHKRRKVESRYFPKPGAISQGRQRGLRSAHIEPNTCSLSMGVLRVGQTV